MRKRLVIANWKMYMQSQKEAKKFAASLRRSASKLSGVEVWIAAPASMIFALAGKGPIKVGAQTLSRHAEGAHTGELSGEMLRDVGAHFCIVGHSERRNPPAGGGETNEAVREQLVRAAEASLTPVLCVGESERTLEGAHFTKIEEQLTEGLRGNRALGGKLVVAYEPVWAIGKSAQDAMKPQELEETIIFIRKTLADIVGREGALKVPILYGGSVEGENAATLLAEGGVNGFLVGHASAKLDSFLEIVNACKK
jgi:triosephosphate isomerase